MKMWYPLHKASQIFDKVIRWMYIQHYIAEQTRNYVNLNIKDNEKKFPQFSIATSLRLWDDEKFSFIKFLATQETKRKANTWMCQQTKDDPWPVKL